MDCPQCNNSNDKTNRFCIECGEPLINDRKNQKMVNKLKETFRDKSRDNLVHVLMNLGIKAEMVERGVMQEKIGDEWWTRRLGLISIENDPIKWINICKKDRSKNSPPQWRYIFIIPAERLGSGKNKIKIKTIRKKTFPVFGKVVDTIWKGNDRRLTDTLSNEAEIKRLAKTIGNIHLESLSEPISGWKFRISSGHSDFHELITSETWGQFRKLSDILETNL